MNVGEANRLRDCEQELDKMRKRVAELESPMSHLPPGEDRCRALYGIAAAQLRDILPPFRELIEWADNWLPDEAKDQGARDVLRRCKAVFRGGYEKFCACGRRPMDCDGSRKACRGAT